MSSNALKLLILFLSCAALFAPGTGLVCEGFRMLARGLHHRDPDEKMWGCASVVAGLIVIGAAYCVGVPGLIHLIIVW